MAKTMTQAMTLEELLASKDLGAKLEQISFESGLKLVEELVARVESGTLPLDQSVCCYEKGVELVKHLRSLLSGAEAKLKILQKAAAPNGQQPE